MNTFWILMEQIELFIVYLVIGMILVRTGVLSDKGLDWIARVVMKLSLPTMIFVNVISQVDRVALVQSLSIIGLAVTASILLFGLGVALTKLFHVEGDRSQIYRAMTMFGNVGFMGIPIIEELYGKGAIIYVVLYSFVYSIIFYSYGIYLFEKEKALQTGEKAKIKFEWKKMINPGIAASLIAMVIFLFQIKVPAPAVSFVDYLGNSCIPLSMILTGVSVAKLPLIEVFKDKKMYFFTFLKMLVIPIIAAVLIRNFHLDPVLSGIMVLMFGMPNGSMAVMMSIDYSLDSSICSRGIVLTTLLSIITLPIVAYLI